jgi:hypothetical protein
VFSIFVRQTTRSADEQAIGRKHDYAISGSDPSNEVIEQPP